MSTTITMNGKERVMAPGIPLKSLHMGTIFRHLGGLLIKLDSGHGVTIADGLAATVVLVPMREGGTVGTYTQGRTFTMSLGAKIALADIVEHVDLDIVWSGS